MQEREIFGKLERIALKRIAKDLEYDKVNPQIYWQIEYAADEKEATKAMERTRRMLR